MAKERFLYKQVYEGIRQEIISGKFAAGGKLPMEDELKEQYKVSAITIKKALEMLSEEGLIFRVPGRGTFVSDRTAAQAGTGRSLSGQMLSVQANPDRLVSGQPEMGRQDTGWPETDSPDAYYKDADNAVIRDAPEGQGKQKSGLIGLILEHVASPFGLDILYRLYQKAEEAGYKLCIRFSFGVREKETDEIGYLLHMGVEGLIIMPCHGAHYNTSLLRLILEGFPVVLIDKKMEGIPVPAVMTDGAAATMRLVEHLAERGCEQVGLVTLNTSGTVSLIERHEGFYEGVRKCSLATCRECVLPSRFGDIFENTADPNTVKWFYNYLTGLIELPDGIVCTEFGLISALIQAAGQAEIVLGEQLKLCCIDEDYLAPRGIYVTHMKQDELMIADKAMELMTEWVNGRPPEVKDYRIPAIFRQGETT